MKKLILVALVAILPSIAGAEVFQIETQIANDYVLLNEIHSIRLASSSNLPQVIGSKATLEITGLLGVRGCDYTGFAFLLQPQTSGDMTTHKFNVTVAPLYQGAPNIELSRRGCRSIAMGEEAFQSNVDLVVREMLGPGVRWIYSFLGTSGVKLRIIEVSYIPSRGWSMRDL